MTTSSRSADLRTGEPRREFLYVDDMAAASEHVMQLPKSSYETMTEPMLSHINVGFGEDISIRDLAHFMFARC